DQRLEGVGQICRGINGAVESHGQSRSRAHQTTGALDVYSVISSERAGYQAGDLCASGELDVTDHRLNLVPRVDKSAATRSNHHEHGNLRLVHYGRDQSGARSRASFAQVGAQL